MDLSELTWSTRDDDPDDRRHMIVTATATGLARLQAYEDEFDRHLQGLLIDMDDLDAARIASALHQLNMEISAKRDAGYFKTGRKKPHA
jgi:DNA-binding MarR family transcriptional regulator